MVDVSKYDGKVYDMHVHDEAGSCVNCMVGMLTCCTYDYKSTFAVIDKDTIVGKDHKICGCCYNSPCPCCIGWVRTPVAEETSPL